MTPIGFIRIFPSLKIVSEYDFMLQLKTFSVNKLSFTNKQVVESPFLDEKYKSIANAAFTGIF